MRKSASRILIVFAIMLISGSVTEVRAQFVDGTKGLLFMPSAEMNQSGTFMISSGFLNKHFVPAGGWNYNTVNYGLSITFWSRLEVAYICTIFNGSWRPEDPSTLTERERIIVNQDRHFSARIQALKEGEFGKSWVPSVVLGVSDPTTSWGGSYGKVTSDSNGYFNRYYLAVTKHFESVWGVFGAHAAFQFTFRKDFLRTGPCFGFTWDPVWLNRPESFLSSFRVIAEYDSRDFNIGLSSSIWKDRFEAWVCMQDCRYPSAGLRFKWILH